MKNGVFVVKIYRGGSRNPASVEFHPVHNPRVVDLAHNDNGFEKEQHKEFIDKGATHAVDVIVNEKLDHLFIFKQDVMFVESPAGETIFSINRKT